MVLGIPHFRKPTDEDSMEPCDLRLTHRKLSFDYIWLLLSKILRRFIVDLPGYKCPAIGVTKPVLPYCSFLLLVWSCSCLTALACWQARSWARLALRKCSASLGGAKPLPFPPWICARCKQTRKNKRHFRWHFHTFPSPDKAVSEPSATWTTPASARLSSNVIPGYGNLWARWLLTAAPTCASLIGLMTHHDKVHYIAKWWENHLI